MRRAVLVILTVLLTALAALAARGDTTVGRASVTGGDTLGIRSVKFRLHGIDTPESSQI